MMRAIGIGAGVALLAVAVAVALVVTGVVDLGAASQSPEKLLVIGTAPDEEGAEVAAFAFVLEKGSESALVLDTMRPATVPNTSAGNAREAYPFVGGAGVAEALAAQTGGEALPWVVLSADAWGKLVDDGGGIAVDVPQDVSVYQNGVLTIFDGGERRLTSSQARALLASIAYIERPADRKAVSTQVTSRVSALVAFNLGAVREAVAGKASATSLSQRQWDSLSADE